MADALDTELIAPINRLHKVQKVVGGAKTKDGGNGFTGGGRDEGGRMDRFIDLKNQMGDRLASLRENLEMIQQMEKAPGSNPKELIAAQSRVRSDLAALNEDWRELDQLYRNEARKRRSKFSPEEMAYRQEALIELQNEINAIKEMQRSGYVKGYQIQRLDKMEDSELFKPRSNGADIEAGGKEGSRGRGVIGSRNNNMTDIHRQGLQLLRERDAKIDEEVVAIGEGVDVLHEIARAAREEITSQNRMLDTLEQKIDDVHEHVTNVNAQLKTTLEEARKSDKICVDIVCILLLIGMIIVLYKVSTSAKK